MLAKLDGRSTRKVYVTLFVGMELYRLDLKTVMTVMIRNMMDATNVNILVMRLVLIVMRGNAWNAIQ